MNRSMRLLWLALLAAPAAIAAETGFPLMKAPVDLSDEASLQRGAKLFINYCSGCHAMTHLRYNRLARDLGIPEELVEKHLIFTHDRYHNRTKIGEPIRVTMQREYAEKVFGNMPPDLTLIARARTPDWLYTYLHAFYLDPEAPWGVDNAVFPHVGMPHVLAHLEGVKAPRYETHVDAQGNEHRTLVGFDMVRAGVLDAAAYDRLVADLVNFMTYAAEPARLVRYKVGAWVIAFLVLFAVLAYFLKKEYWRDVR